jgi:hypothetical protein
MNGEVHDGDEAHAKRTRQRAHRTCHTVVGPASIGITISGKLEKLSDYRKSKINARYVLPQTLVLITFEK